MSENPRDVVRAAGAWLGSTLEDDGFTWAVSALRLQRRIGTVKHQIHFQASKFNRTGELIDVGSMLNVRDSALEDWRNANRAKATRTDDYVCGHMLGYAVGRNDIADGEMDLTNPGTRLAVLESFAAMLRRTILPWFDETTSPEAMVTSRAGYHTNFPIAIVEWLAFRGRPDLIPAYISRYLARNAWAAPHFAQGVAFATAGRPSSDLFTANDAAKVGWSATILTAAP